MLNFLAQQGPLPFYLVEGGSQDAALKVAITMLIGFAMFFGMLQLPARARRPVVVTITMLFGAFYFVQWLWPVPIKMEPTEIPLNGVEGFGKLLQDGVPIMSSILQTLNGILLGLGVYSVVKIHSTRISKKHVDAPFSIVLLLSFLAMLITGFADYNQVLRDPKLADQANWGIVQYAKDMMFDGMLQSMDAAMFSIIAFFILSAAYRAFRIRSVEATILLGTALIMMLSLMGLVEFASGEVIKGVTGGDPGHFANNFALKTVADWIRGNVQAPGIRALEFGVGIGALSMGLRLWLSLEKGGSK